MSTDHPGKLPGSKLLNNLQTVVLSGHKICGKFELVSKSDHSEVFRFQGSFPEAPFPQQLAIKFYGDDESLETEKQLLERLADAQDRRLVPRLYGRIFVAGFHGLAMEYLQGRSLWEIHFEDKTHPGLDISLDEQFSGVERCYTACSESCVIQADCAPRNLMLVSDESGQNVRVVLLDFAFGEVIEDKERCRSLNMADVRYLRETISKHVSARTNSSKAQAFPV